MTKLKTLFQKAWTAVTNPGQDERVELIVNAIANAFQIRKQAFDLDSVLEPIECTTTDVRVASKRYYEKLLLRFWADGVPESGRKKTLEFVAAKLKIDDVTKNQSDLNAATVFFGAKLAEYLEDGVITDNELAVLANTSSFVKLSVPDFVRSHMSARE